MSKSADEKFSLNRSIVLIGIMGSGKTTIGKRLADICNLPFQDADRLIQKDAGLSIDDIFRLQGEAAFRAMERDMIARLLHEGPLVLSPGGGAFADAETRAAIKAAGALTIWLKVGENILKERVARNDRRPLKHRLSELLAERTPFYRQADLIVECDDGPVEGNVDKIVAALRALAP